MNQCTGTSCIVTNCIRQAGYLFCDNVVWLKKIKVIDWDIKPMQRMSGKLW